MNQLIFDPYQNPSAVNFSELQVDSQLPILMTRNFFIPSLCLSDAPLMCFLFKEYFL